MKIREDEFLCSVVWLSHTTGADGKNYEMTCLPLQYVYGWLFTINPKNVSQDAKEKVSQYRIMCYDVLYKYFTGSMQRTIETNNAEIELLEDIADKCLPDKEPIVSNNETKGDTIEEQPKPKFKVGQLVRVLAERAFGKIEKIETYDEDDNTYRLEYLPDFWFEPFELEPYTENKEPMEIMSDFHPIINPLTEQPMPNPKVEEFADRIAKELYDEVSKQLKDNMEENNFGKEDNFPTKELYNALCELETASIKVRKALVSI